MIANIAILLFLIVSFIFLYHSMFSSEDFPLSNAAALLLLIGMIDIFGDY